MKLLPCKSSYLSSKKDFIRRKENKVLTAINYWPQTLKINKTLSDVLENFSRNEKNYLPFSVRQTEFGKIPATGLV